MVSIISAVFQLITQSSLNPCVSPGTCFDVLLCVPSRRTLQRMNLATLWTLIIEQSENKQCLMLKAKKPLCVIVYRMVMSAPGSYFCIVHMFRAIFTWRKQAQRQYFPSTASVSLLWGFQSAWGLPENTAIIKKLYATPILASCHTSFCNEMWSHIVMSRPSEYK